MPGTLLERHKLGHLPFTVDKEVSGDTQLMDFTVEGMFVRIQAVGEQRPDPRATELARGEADVVDDQEGDILSRAVIAIGRGRFTNRL